jgi:hypothetical protein
MRIEPCRVGIQTYHMGRAVRQAFWVAGTTGESSKSQAPKNAGEREPELKLGAWRFSGAWDLELFNRG